MIPPTFADNPPGDRIEVPIELLAPLVEGFGARGGDSVVEPAASDHVRSRPRAAPPLARRRLDR
jgi:hypothetical protein